MKYYLHLADGSKIEAENIGFDKQVEGEVVFTTAMVGYSESMTDPSFAGQILVFTYPLVGNYGIPKSKYLYPQLLANFESEKIWVETIIVTSVENHPSHQTNFESLISWCKKNKKPLLVGVDTRALTLKLREHGVLHGVISSQKIKKMIPKIFDYSIVSCSKIINYTPKRSNGKTLALIDCGVKHGIIRALLGLGYSVVRVPWNVHPLSLKKQFEGVVVSNGPGDPKDWMPTVSIISDLIKNNMPILGICLGHQLVALAIGANTYKLKYGHRGLNQPCQNILTKKCYLTSQNHGYAVDQKTIPKDFTPWFINLNDGTNEGLKNEKRKIWSVQFHPEGCPGPFDSKFIFSLL